jgi:hypothetical protein
MQQMLNWMALTLSRVPNPMPGPAPVVMAITVVAVTVEDQVFEELWNPV